MRIRDAIATFRGHRVPHMDIIGAKRWWFGVSGVLLAASILGLLGPGLNFSIAFTGGSQLQFQDESGASIADYQAVLSRFGLQEARVEIQGSNQINIRTESLTELDAVSGTSSTPQPTSTATSTATPTATGSPTPTSTPTATPTATASPTGSPTPTATGSPAATPTVSPTPTFQAPPVPTPRADRLRAELARVAGISPDEINEQDVGPTWGGTISNKAIQGLIVFLVLVTLYITLRFELKMAAGALTALIHDLVITAGIYALVGREVTPETVIAILTIMGYSLYDTVVIYDKVKENTESAALVARETYGGVVNLSLNQVLMRSVNTSLVVLLPIGALLLFGGQTLKDFAFALFIGTAIGAYSSIFVAAPALTILKEREPRYQQIRTRAEARATRTGLRVVPSGREGPDAARGLEPAAVTATSATARPSRQGSSSSSSRSGTTAKKKKKPQGKPKRRRR